MSGSSRLSLLYQRALASAPQILLVMGVAGSGKTTVGRATATALGWQYFEADDFHSPANREKMSRGVPLDDADRAPWLQSIRGKLDELRAAGTGAVFTCSALKESYRQVLLVGTSGTRLVHLAGDPEILRQRLQQRTGHFMPAALLDSQLAVLELPVNALTLDIRLSPAQLVRAILADLSQA